MSFLAIYNNHLRTNQPIAEPHSVGLQNTIMASQAFEKLLETSPPAFYYCLQTIDLIVPLY